MRPVVRPVYYWIRAASDRGMTECLNLLKKIKGIGEITLHQLERQLPINCKDFFNAVDKIDLSTKTHEKVREVHESLNLFKEKVADYGLAEALRNAMDYLNIDTEQPDPIRLLELASAFGKDLSAFSHHLEQNSVATVYDDRAEAVSIMTIHASKGLEFPVVFVTGFEEGLIPCNIQGLTSDLEEERRLFYVGLTRAQDDLILTSSKSRTLFGKTCSQSISRFASEIPSHLIKKTYQMKKAKKETKYKQLNLFDKLTPSP